jgi:hypothetical protein
MEVSGQLHTLTNLAPGKEPLVPLDRKLGGPQSRSGHGGEERNSQSQPGLEYPNIQIAMKTLNLALDLLTFLVPSSLDEIIVLYTWTAKMCHLSACIQWLHVPPKVQGICTLNSG